MAQRHPWFSYGLMIVLGLIPTALVTSYYDHLPNRMVIQWDVFGRMTVIGTRASTVLLVANFAAVAGLLGTAVAAWQHRAFKTADALRPFIILNTAQIVAINLTCLMLVSDALGMKLTIKPMIAPAMAVLLFSAGVLCWRAEGESSLSATKLFGAALAGSALTVLGLNAYVSNEIVGHYASGFALLAMIAAALPSAQK